MVLLLHCSPLCENIHLQKSLILYHYRIRVLRNIDVQSEIVSVKCHYVKSFSSEICSEWKTIPLNLMNEILEKKFLGLL